MIVQVDDREPVLVVPDLGERDADAVRRTVVAYFGALAARDTSVIEHPRDGWHATVPLASGGSVRLRVRWVR